MTASQKSDVKIHDKIYINGEWTSPAGSGMLDVMNSTSEEVMGRIHQERHGRRRHPGHRWNGTS